MWKTKRQVFRFRNLAPGIYRQRLVIEGYPGFLINEDHIKGYLKELCDVLDMKPLIDPVTSRSDKYGWAGWTHWETSGAHFYAWDKPKLFFSVDIYTCKPFNTKDAVHFTDQYLQAKKLVHRSF